MQKISHTYLSGEKLSVFFATGGLALAIRTTTSGVALTKRASGALGPAHFGAVGLVSEKQAGALPERRGVPLGRQGSASALQALALLLDESLDAGQEGGAQGGDVVVLVDVLLCVPEVLEEGLVIRLEPIAHGVRVL